MSPRELKQRKRNDYGYILEYRTRWSDNDMYDHMNNSIYNFLYGLVVHSHGDFFGSIGFPAVADLALRVNKLGRTSVTYEVALFERGVEDVKSVGELVHVFVDRETGRPAAQGMESKLRDGLQKIQVKQSKL
ncbi:thioesterase superfamily protein [Marssonina coronariae]|uniref:Thioesterase superfamily protein n=1 Tax=Diplocarpon coronariae TaxID=2795749 RepID=A0A218ZAQ1_9HELO|nr:thioesterase superfamily protein [Marssonina coronariae]